MMKILVVTEEGVDEVAEDGVEVIEAGVEVTEVVEVVTEKKLAMM